MHFDINAKNVKSIGYISDIYYGCYIADTCIYCSNTLLSTPNHWLVVVFLGGDAETV